MKKEALEPRPVFAQEGEDMDAIVLKIFHAFLQERLTALESEEEKYV